MPLEIKITVHGLKEVRRRFGGFPRRVAGAIQKALDAALLELQGSVPPYPTPPTGSTYIRTGTLGRSLGANLTGGKIGRADLYQVRPVGNHGFEAQWGTRLGYAPYVIGATRQAGHMRHWWTLKNVAANARRGIGRIFQILGEELATWLKGGNG
jgi:hypothetical protein